MPILLLFILMPVIELYVLLKVGTLIGAGWTILLVFFTAIVGWNLLKRQGFKTFFSAQEKMNKGQMPANEMLEGLMLAVAGALLLTPGFVTDTIGFLLLTPLVRKSLAAKIVQKGVFAMNQQMQGFYKQYGSGNVYESHEHYTEKTQQGDSGVTIERVTIIKDDHAIEGEIVEDPKSDRS